MSEEGGKEGGDREAGCSRTLLCPEEWSDPSCRKVLGEYHKEGLPDVMARVETELDQLEQRMAQGGLKVGADQGASVTAAVEVPASAGSPEGIEAKAGEASPAGEGSPADASGARPPLPSRPIDLAMVEVIVYVLSRLLFGQGASFPVRREGLVDMEIALKGKDVVVNTNELFYNLPDLSVWRIVYTHKGKRIVEFGRGIRKGMKIHFMSTLFLLIELWRQGRRSRARTEGGAEGIGKEEG